MMEKRIDKIQEELTEVKINVNWLMKFFWIIATSSVGALIVGTIDNIIKPKLVGKRAKVHPAIILIGILGGIKLLGFIGLIIGPVILATAIELFKIENRMKENKTGYSQF